MKYLLKNGTVVSGTAAKKLDVIIEGEKIVKENGLHLLDTVDLVDPGRTLL